MNFENKDQIPFMMYVPLLTFKMIHKTLNGKRMFKTKSSWEIIQHLSFDDGYAGLDTFFVVSNRTVLTQPTSLPSYFLILGHLRASVRGLCCRNYLVGLQYNTHTTICIYLHFDHYIRHSTVKICK